MNDQLFQRDEEDSPCVRLCVMHPRENLCIGCYRSLQEIADWPAMSPAARAALRASLPERAPRLRRRAGGRKARTTSRDGDETS